MDINVTLPSIFTMIDAEHSEVPLRSKMGCHLLFIIDFIESN